MRELDRMNEVGFVKRLLGMLVLSLAFFASPLVAQEEAGRPRVTISATTGWMMGGPGSGYEALLEAAGFGDVLRGGCTLGSCNLETDYPITNSDPGPGSNFRVAYSQWSLLEFAFSMGTADPSETEGYSSVIVPNFGSFSEVEATLRMFAPTAGVRWHFLGAGVGPAYYTMNTLVTDEDMVFDESTESKWGALIEADGQFQMFKKLILELRVQYRLVGETDIGPFEVESYPIPATPVDHSHIFFAFGLGLAF